MKKKSDIVYIMVNILCLALLISDIEFRDYFSQLSVSYHSYIYPLIMTNLACPLIICLLIVFRQARHHTASDTTNIIIDTGSAVGFLVYSYFLLRYRLDSTLLPESFVIVCLFIVPAIFNIYKIIKAKRISKIFEQEKRHVY